MLRDRYCRSNIQDVNKFQIPQKNKFQGLGHNLGIWAQHFEPYLRKGLLEVYVRGQLLNLYWFI